MGIVGFKELRGYAFALKKRRGSRGRCRTQGCCESLRAFRLAMEDCIYSH
jgi:hypothetical protein